VSHIHLPDGVLPVWLWVSGYIVAIFIGFLLIKTANREELTRRLPLLGMMSAAMVLGASVEIIPIAYHVNLTAMSGILLGPSLIFLSTLVVNVILALFGHGGITVIGLNTLTLSIEGILGYFLFRLFWKTIKKLTPAVFLATFIALMASTVAMIVLVSLGTSHYEELIHPEKTGFLGLELGKEKEGHHADTHGEETIDLRRFMTIVLPLGFIGWLLEGVITALMARYIYRLRPDLLAPPG
jgi:cobalt/nickel transport system permease protein